jgi:S-formylglutathione hydrolase FrmB
VQAGGVFLVFSISLALQLAFMHAAGLRNTAMGSARHGRVDPGQARLITPTPTPSPALFTHTPACGLDQGTVVEAAIPIPGQVRDLPFRAYLPPCYDAESPLGYPTLYFLHGLLGDDKQWEQAGALDQADELFSSGVTPPFIMIMPWERTGLDLEPALVSHLVPYVDQAFNTQHQAPGRGIGGLSRGGGQALQIGLKHPDVFGQISLHSPAVLHDDALILGWLQAIPTDSLPSLWIDIGERDPLFSTTMHLVEQLLGNGFAPTTQINPGEHDMAYWRTHVETYLRWHAGLWLGQHLRTYAATRHR